MKKLEEAVNFFKSNKSYQRLFEGMKKNYISYNCLKGNIKIDKPTIEERQLLSGLMKKDFSKNESISINLQKLQQIISNSRFSGVELEALLKEYYQNNLISKNELKVNYQNSLDSFLNDVLKENIGTIVYEYLNNSFKNKDSLFQFIKTKFNQYGEGLKNEILNACRCVNCLPKEHVRIPVFASEMLGNPHGLDKKTLCGRIFLELLSYFNNVNMPKNSEEIYELYYNNKLLVDDISSFVICRNIVGKIDGLTLHEGLQGFQKYHEPIFLSLYNLSCIFNIEESSYKKAVIVENPAVFMGIIEKSKIQDFPLICTYGQVKLAGILLLDLLVQKNYQLYYSGDIDPEGMQIADRLKQRYADNMKFIGFDRETYKRTLSNIILQESRLNKLNSLKSEELISLSYDLKKFKKVAYEEENIDYIVNFIENETINN